jgi:uncharacterized protein DUF1707/uncharacterized protein DUF4190
VTEDPVSGLNGVPQTPGTPSYGSPSYGPPSYGSPSYGRPAYGYGQPPPGMRASAADRERAMDVLKAAYGEGRLTKEEFDERSARVMASRNYGELGAIVADLPVGPYLPSAPYQVAPPPPYYQPASATANGLAIGALILSLLGFSLPAVIMGHISRGQIRRNGQHGDGIAIASLVFGYLGMAFWALIVVAGVVSAAHGTGGLRHPRLTAPAARPRVSGGCPAAGWKALRRRPPAGPRPGRSSSSASCLPSAARAASACG